MRLTSLLGMRLEPLAAYQASAYRATILDNGRVYLCKQALHSYVTHVQPFEGMLSNPTSRRPGTLLIENACNILLDSSLPCDLTQVLESPDACCPKSSESRTLPSGAWQGYKWTAPSKVPPDPVGPWRCALH